MTSSNASNEYMLLFSGPDWDKGMNPEETQRVLDRAMAWFENLDRQGKVKATQALARTGAVVTAKNQRPLTDGPFAESKEAIGGYLVLRVDTLDEAIAIAKQCPTLPYGITVEVRPTLSECPIAKRLREQTTVAA